MKNEKCPYGLFPDFACLISATLARDATGILIRPCPEKSNCEKSWERSERETRRRRNAQGLLNLHARR